jgi:hypothetical protein
VLATRGMAANTHLAGLPSIVVPRLNDADARELVVSALLGPIDSRVLDRIVAEAQGNPLALLELPRAIAPGHLAGGFAVGGDAPLATPTAPARARAPDIDESC